MQKNLKVDDQRLWEDKIKDLVELIYYNSLSVTETRTLLAVLDIRTKHEVLTELKKDAKKDFYKEVSQ